MGSFQGHFLPGALFFVFGIWYCIKYSYRHFAKRRISRANGWKKLLCNLDVIEGCAKLIFPVLGIVLEQVTNDGPNFHLTNSNNDYWDGNNWSHCTMYMFFIFAGIADLVLHRGSTPTPKGVNHLLMGLALFVEGYLFYFHTHGRGTLEVRLHSLLIIAIWSGGCALSLLWVAEAYLAEENNNTYTQEKEDRNGYVPLLTENCEESILLDKTKVNHVNEIQEEAVNPEKTQLSTQTQQLHNIMMNALSHTIHSRSQGKSAVQITLQMTAAASMLLQGTWFIQIGSILYPPGKEAWSDTGTNVEFATTFFTWHLAAIITFLSIVYNTIGAIMLRRADRNRLDNQL